jgi:drug/metabolite transporter (DMT)-like permease
VRSIERIREHFMHTTTGRWRFGLALTLITVAMWASLPIPLKVLLGAMDAWTITWLRFLVAALLLGAWLARRGRLPALHRMPRRAILLLAIAVLGLAGNYICYLLGLDHIAPAAAQVVIQLAPMFLLLGGLVVFRERFSALQWLGFAILTAGLLLFFHDRVGDLLQSGEYSLGVALTVLAGALWAAYAMAQKQLLRALPSEAIMWTIYAVSVLLFLPAIDLAPVARLDGFHIAMLLFACLNTIVAYGCFAEALDHWEASRVSAVLAVTPLLTIAIVAWLARHAPGILPPEPVDALSVAGACIVVVGSGMSALAPREPRAGQVPGTAVPRAPEE